MTLPLPSIFIATMLEKAPAKNSYKVQLYTFTFLKIKWAYWLHYTE